LTRNFGQASALLAGYEHARSACVITLSADGQEPPGLVNEMLRGFFEEGYEVVLCARSGRDESLYRRITSSLFFSLMGRVTFRSMPKGGFDVWLMGGRALDAFLRNQDATQLLQWRVLWMGFKTKTITYRRRARLAGASHFTLAKKLNTVLAGLLGYSAAAIRIILLSGCACSLLGLVGAALVGANLLLGHALKPWALVTAAVLLVGGLQMSMLGVIGEYVWRVLAEVRDRDMYLIDAIYPPEEG
jgi:dolichol-phosphate mannosyltransferase